MRDVKIVVTPSACWAWWSEICPVSVFLSMSKVGLLLIGAAIGDTASVPVCANI